MNILQRIGAAFKGQIEREDAATSLNTAEPDWKAIAGRMAELLKAAGHHTFPHESNCDLCRWLRDYEAAKQVKP